MTKKHRNSQKRIYFQDACYFITVKTFNNFPFFREKILCDLFVGNLRLCKQLKEFLLYGWVLIYDHFHLQVQPGDKFNISDVMFSIKKQFSHDVNRIMGYNKLYFDVKSETLKAGKRLPAFRVSSTDEMAIIKHQKFVTQLHDRFIQKYKNQNIFPKFRWKESFHDHYIRNDRDFDEHMEYIANNPVKHGLPDDWSYVYTNSEYENLLDEC